MTVVDVVAMADLEERCRVMRMALAEAGYPDPSDVRAYPDGRIWVNSSIPFEAGWRARELSRPPAPMCRACAGAVEYELDVQVALAALDACEAAVPLTPDCGVVRSAS